MGLLDSFKSFQEKRGRSAFVSQTRKQLDKSFFEKSLARERLSAASDASVSRRKALSVKAREKARFEALPRVERAKIRAGKVLSFAERSGRRVSRVGGRVGRASVKGSKRLKGLSDSFSRAEKKLEKKAKSFGPPLGGSLGESLFKNR